MGKKKRSHPDAEEILARPWCYYCERDFDDLKILISHQKAKHFKCDRCGRRLNTAGGLSVHMNQVHKESLTAVDNALPNRANPDIEIFGMEGIPEDVVGAHNQRVLSQFQQAEAERRAVTGNSSLGGPGSGGPKKPKFESPAELKKRLAEHKAKMAEQATGGSSGGATPISPSISQSPAGPQAGSPSYSHSQQMFNAVSNSTPYGTFAQPYDSSGVSYQQPTAVFSPQHQQQPGFPLETQPYSHAPQQFSAPGVPSYSNQFPQSSRQFGAASPPLPFMQNLQQPPRIHTPPQIGSMPQRPGSLPPAAPGLPQRPAFGAPALNAFQMQQMHHGQIPGTAVSPAGSPPPAAWNPMSNGGASYNGQDQLLPMQGPSQGQGASVSYPPGHPINAASDAGTLPAMSIPAESGEGKSTKTGPGGGAVKIKTEKDKDKAIKMVYSDNEVSPEEKMAKLPRYAFASVNDDQTMLEGGTTALSGFVRSG